MKQTILLLFFTTFHAFAFAQIDKKAEYSYAVVYDYNFQPSKEDKATRISEMMFLQVGKGFSNYLSLNQYRADSIIEELAREAELTNRIPSMGRADQRPQATVHHKVFFERSSNQMHFLGRFIVHRAHYKEAIPQLNWQMHEEEKEVAGYNCKKATTSFGGRDYTAWYAPTIELHNGPYKFNGLPGLILSIYDTDKEHVFTAVRVEKKNIVENLREWKGMYVHEFPSKEEFLAYAKKMKDNPALMLQQDVIRVPQDKMEETANRLKTSIEKNNNPIEREQ